jgi:hypothetical protein
MNQGFVSESTAGKITDSAPGESPGSATLPFIKLLNRHGYVKTQSIVLIWTNVESKGMLPSVLRSSK